MKKTINFIVKLSKILKDDNKEIIDWNSEENGFIIKDHKQFMILLKKYFNTSNYSSFIRQLNMYGFQKVKDSNNDIFTNPFFLKNDSDMISLIKRKEIKKSTKQINKKEKIIQKIINLKRDFYDMNDTIEIINAQTMKLLEQNKKIYNDLMEFKKEKNLCLKTFFALYYLLFTDKPENLLDKIIGYIKNNSNSIPNMLEYKSIFEDNKYEDKYLNKSQLDPNIKVIFQFISIVKDKYPQVIYNYFNKNPKNNKFIFNNTENSNNNEDEPQSNQINSIKFDSEINNIEEISNKSNNYRNVEYSPNLDNILNTNSRKSSFESINNLQFKRLDSFESYN